MLDANLLQLRYVFYPLQPCFATRIRWQAGHIRAVHQTKRCQSREKISSSSEPVSPPPMSSQHSADEERRDAGGLVAAPSPDPTATSAGERPTPWGVPETAESSPVDGDTEHHQVAAYGERLGPEPPSPASDIARRVVEPLDNS